eukprot:scaffold5233_cov178-Amphora_coffeaeformis.AAC.7
MIAIVTESKNVTIVIRRGRMHSVGGMHPMRAPPATKGHLLVDRQLWIILEYQESTFRHFSLQGIQYLLRWSPRISAPRGSRGDTWAPYSRIVATRSGSGSAILGTKPDRITDDDDGEESEEGGGEEQVEKAMAPPLLCVLIVFDFGFVETSVAKNKAAVVVEGK